MAANSFTERPIQTNQRGIRTIMGRVANAGTAVITQGQAFSAVRDSTGLVTVTALKPGKTVQSFSAIVEGAASAIGSYVRASVISEIGVVQFATFAADAVDGAPADLGFAFSITLKDVSL